MMDEKKVKNIILARKVWKYLLNGETMSSISQILGVHKSEVSNIKKYTKPEMYIFDDKEEKIYIDELFEKRKLVKQYKHDIKKYEIKLRNLQIQLQKYQKPWWRKLMEFWS